MESRFGHDFSRVRVHADGNAAESARVIGARAYTVGHNIVFGLGRYDSNSIQGRHLLAHELAHVVQQRAGIHLVNGVSKAGDPYEQHADRVAELVVQGSFAESLLARTPRHDDKTLSHNASPPVQMQHDEDVAPADETRVATADPELMLSVASQNCTAQERNYGKSQVAAFQNRSIGTLDNRTKHMFKIRADEGKNRDPQRFVYVSQGNWGGDNPVPHLTANGILETLNDIDFIYPTLETPINCRVSGRFKIGSNDATVIPSPFDPTEQRSVLDDWNEYDLEES